VPKTKASFLYSMGAAAAAMEEKLSPGMQHVFNFEANPKRK